MGRLLLIAVSVLILVWLVRRALSGPPAEGGEPGQAGEAGEQKGELVSCAHCALNLPKSDARSAEGRFYCSEEHWRRGPRDG